MADDEGRLTRTVSVSHPKAMPSRFVLQAAEKIDAVCATMERAGRLPAGTIRALSDGAGVPYSTLKSAIQKGRFSPEIEFRLARFCGFDHDHPSWVDDAVLEVKRRGALTNDYPGRDTLEHFKKHLLGHPNELSIRFRASQRGYDAHDPHMVRHELSDLGQATPAGESVLFFLKASFEPFFHPTGIRFGFRRAALLVDFGGPEGARGDQRLGFPTAILLGDAHLHGETTSNSLRWKLERSGENHGVLAGEYSTNDPLFTLADHADGTKVISRIESRKIGVGQSEGWSQRIAKTRNDVATRNGTAATRRNRSQRHRDSRAAIRRNRSQ